MSSEHEEAVVRPLIHTGRRFYIVVALLLAVIGWLAFAWWTQLTQGLTVTGMRDWGTLMGAPWGLYTGNFIWFVGVAHGGIAVSAGVRILKLERYRPVARMAEVVTVLALMMAALNLVFDVGRPDRIFNMVFYYGVRVWQSPLVWDFTVIVLYFALSITYLYLSLRKDLAIYRERLPSRWQWLYNLLLVGYRPEEEKKVNQILWWMAISILVLMALLSGGVIPWVFGLMSSQAGWYGAVQGPYFLTAALTSAIAVVILVVALLRRVFGWEQHIKLEIFRGLGALLAVFMGVYLWFILHEQLTATYAGPEAEFSISQALLTGRFAPIYWTMLIVGFFIPLAYLSVQAVRPGASKVGGIVISALLVAIFLWVKRFLIVVPSLLEPRLPYYLTGSYVPTWVEWSLVIGSFAIAALLYILFAKLFPLIELERS